MKQSFFVAMSLEMLNLKFQEVNTKKRKKLPGRGWGRPAAHRLAGLSGPRSSHPMK